MNVHETNSSINVRVDGKLKDEAYAIFEKIGVSPSDAVRMFLSQVTMQRGLPFEVKIPNTETLEAFAEVERGEATPIEDIDTFFDELMLSDDETDTQN